MPIFLRPLWTEYANQPVDADRREQQRAGRQTVISHMLKR